MLENLTLDTVIYGNTLQQYLLVVAIFIAAIIAAMILRKIIIIIENKLTKRFSDGLGVLRHEKKLKPALMYIPLYTIIKYLKLPEAVHSFITTLGTIVIAVCIVRYVLAMAHTILQAKERKGNISSMAAQSINIFASFLIWVLSILFILNNIGFNINTLLAGIGIGGMAVALASQKLLADVFNYFMILWDRPFTVGDSVTINGHSGNIKRIGVRNTRINSVDGETIIISNSDITNSALSNFQMMDRRRVVTKLGLVYHTPREKLQQIPTLLKEIVESVEGTVFARAHFADFGDSALNVELVYFISSNDYSYYMDQKQKVNFKILEEFEKRGLELAFTTQSVYNYEMGEAGK